MFGATPPRRTTRSSTRNDRDTLWRCSGSNCSENFPGKCMRWSVAIDPATRTGTTKRLRDDEGYGREGGFASAAEGVAAGAAARGVGVVDREALLLDGVGEVDGGAAQVRGAHPVDDHRYAVRRELDVAVQAPLVEEQLVLQAGAATRLDRDAQAEVVPTLLLQQRADLDRGRFSERYVLGRGFGRGG